MKTSDGYPQQKTAMRSALPHLLAFAAIYLACLFYLNFAGEFPAENVLGVLVIFGGFFPAAAWLLTRRAAPLYGAPAFDPKEWAVLGGLLLFVSAVLAAGFKNDWLPADSRLSQVLTLAKKIATFFGVPYLIYRWRFGFSLRDFGFLSFRETFQKKNLPAFFGLAALVLLFTLFMSRQAEPVRSGVFPPSTLAWGLPLVYGWLILEVGLTEEFFFRALLQDRLSAALNNQTAGILWSGLVFALAHVPGVWLRGAGAGEGLPADASLLTCTAYCIPVMGLAGVFLGVVWARTRNFWLVAGIHAAIDLLSNFQDTLFPG